jgi:hypothetical protein
MDSFRSFLDFQLMDEVEELGNPGRNSNSIGVTNKTKQNCGFESEGVKRASFSLSNEVC